MGVTMSDATSSHPLVRADRRAVEFSYSHPLNPNAEMRGVSLSAQAGLERIGFHLIRIPPGKENNIYHAHTCEEELYFVLEGRGIAEIDGEEFEIGPGDFMGFKTPSVAHLLRNPYDEDLVYLVGGERREMELASFPKLGKYIVRARGQAWAVDEANLESFWKAEKSGDGDE